MVALTVQWYRNYHISPNWSQFYNCNQNVINKYCVENNSVHIDRRKVLHNLFLPNGSEYTVLCTTSCSSSLVQKKPNLRCMSRWSAVWCSALHFFNVLQSYEKAVLHGQRYFLLGSACVIGFYYWPLLLLLLLLYSPVENFISNF